eukprot:m.371639 g.371639  ORF g.371639 m.371639 type:complete len:53 (+) comp59247_c0_seq1:77-235(+)
MNQDLTVDHRDFCQAEKFVWHRELSLCACLSVKRAVETARFIFSVSQQQRHT